MLCPPKPTKNGCINFNAVTRSYAGRWDTASWTRCHGQTDSPTHSSRHRVLSPPIYPLLFFRVDSDTNCILLPVAVGGRDTKPRAGVILRNSSPHPSRACHSRQGEISGTRCFSPHFCELFVPLDNSINQSIICIWISVKLLHFYINIIKYLMHLLSSML